MAQKPEETTSPRSEKNTSAAPVMENVISSGDPSGPVNTPQDLAKRETVNEALEADGREQGKVKEEVSTFSSKSEASHAEANMNPQEATAAPAATKS